MRNEQDHIGSSARSFALLEAIMTDGGRSSLSNIARSIALPVPTAHRLAAALVSQGLLAIVGRGIHVAGPRLRRLAAMLEEKQIIAACAAPLLQKLAKRFACVAQLGTFENEMVTYRIKTGLGAANLFTRMDMQLEAYCSGLGKALLAWLPDAELDAYLANGPFIALTPNTIVDGDALRAELATVRDQGFAEDRGEILPDLFCVAVPIHHPDGSAPAAISVSRPRPSHVRSKPFAERTLKILTELQETARQIEQLTFHAECWEV